VQEVKVELLETFFQRLTGALTRPLLRNKVLLFSPGGSVHTIFMRQNIDVAFLDKDYKVLFVKSGLRPWRFQMAPKKTCFTIEAMEGEFDKLSLGKIFYYEKD